MRRWLQERRDRLRELAVADARNRCTFCRRALAKASYVIRYANPEQRFCSQSCMADQDEKEALSA